MNTVIRAALLAAALSLGASLPAMAQQAASGSASAPAAAAEAPKADAPAAAPTAEAAPAPEQKAPDMDAMVQGLKRDLQSLTDAARQGAQSVLTRESPYVITADQLAVIAAGAVAGALVIDFLGGGGLATLTGAAVGGVAGHWLYTHPMPDMAVTGN
ncbi:MAG: hypothetical protein RLO51_16760 [Thalassobaculum sp.]|uniref:hypothetical protein n=1 Tax=Thalassobaculum sp. TaxID=2022740 RepID=UPI0032EE6243